MSAETVEAPHFSGVGLLKYIRNQNININEVDFSSAPKVLLELHNQSSTVNLLVHLLLEDEYGEKARHFAKYCPPYKNDRKCKDVKRLRESFKKFVQHILFSQKKEPLKTKNGIEGIVDVGLEKLNDHHDQIDDWLDVWSEKYDELLPYITEYIGLLDDEYIDPKPESWERGDDDEGVYSVGDNDEKEYIPNHHLNNLSRIMYMFKAKVSVSFKKIRRLRGKPEGQNPHIEAIKIV